jgi:hypothetical protein
LHLNNEYSPRKSSFTFPIMPVLFSRLFFT